jgi:hypothetical protein
VKDLEPVLELVMEQEMDLVLVMEKVEVQEKGMVMARD